MGIRGKNAMSGALAGGRGRNGWRMTGFLARLLLGVLMAAVVLVVVAALVLHTSRGRELLRLQLLDQLARTFAGEVTVGAVDGFLLDRIVVHDVVIHDAGGNVAMTAASVHITYDLLPLLRRTFHVRQLRIRAPHLSMYYTEEGRLNLARLIEEDDEPSRWRVEIASLVVEDGEARFRDGAGTVHQVTGVEGGGPLVSEARVVRMRVERLDGRWQERPVSVSGSLRFEEEVLVLADAAARVGDSTVRVPWLRLHLPGDIDAGGDTAGGPGPMGARATAGPGCPGECAGFQAHLAAAEIAVFLPDVELRTDVQVDGWLRRDRQDEQDGDAEPWQVGMRARAGPGRVAVRGALRLPADGVPGGELRLHAHALDPGALVAGAPPARLDAEVTATWIGDSFETLRGTLAAGIQGHVDLGAPTPAAGQGPPADPGDAAPGEATGELQLLGHYRIPSARVALHADRGVVQGAARVHAELARDGGWAGVHATLAGEVETAGETLHVTRAHLDARVGDLSQALPVPAAGSAHLVLTARGPADRLAVRGTLTGAALRVAQVRARTLHAEVAVDQVPEAAAGEARIRARGVRYQGAQGEQLIGRVDATLRIHERGRRLRLAFDLGDAGADYGASGLLTGVRGDRRTRIRVARLQARTRDLHWHAREADVVVTDAGAIVVHDLRIESEAAEIHLDARLRRSARPGGAPTGAASIRVPRADLGALTHAFADTRAPDVPPVLGRASLEASVTLPRGPVSASGRVAHLWVPGRLAPVDGRFLATIEGRQLEAAAEVQSVTLGRVEAAVVARTPRDLMDARAWQRFDARDLRLVRVRLDQVVARDLARLLDREELVETGWVSGSARIGPGLESGRLSLQLDHLRVQDPSPAQPRPVIGPVRASLDMELAGSSLRVASVVNGRAYGTVDLLAHATLPAPPLSAAAWEHVGVDLLDSARLTVRDVDLRHLRRHLPGIPDLHGYMDLDMSMREVDGKVRLQSSFRGIRLGRLADEIPNHLHGQVRAELTDEGIRAELRADLDRSPVVRAQAALDVGTRALIRQGARALDRAQVQAIARVPGLPLSSVQQALDIRQDLRGQLDAQVTVEGTVAAPVIAARIQAPGAAVGDLVFTELIALGRYQGGAWSGQLSARQLGGGNILVDARGETAGDSPFRAEVDAHSLRLGFLTPILRGTDSPVTHVDGLLSVDLRVAGTLAQPAMQGWIQLRDGRMSVAEGIEPIRQVRGYLVAEQDGMRIRVSGASGRGTFDLQGRADLDGLSPRAFQATLAAQGVGVRAGATPVAVDGRIVAAGTRTGELWRMEVSVEDSLVRLPARFGDTALHGTGALPDVVYVDVPARQAAREAPGSALALRMRVRTPGGVRVRGEDVEAMADANLDITFLGDELSITGAVEAVRGRVTLLGRRYDIQRARSVFEGRLPPRPRLDVRLAHAANEAMVYIDVEGTTEEPRIELSSSPARYDRAQLVSFVLGGNLGGNDVDTSLRERTTGAIGGLLSSQIEGLVRRTLPVDLLRVGLDRGGEGIAFVTVGKWIRDDLFVAYRRRFTPEQDENANEAQIEYQVSERWMIESRIGDQSIGNIDVLWNRRF